MKLSHQQIEGFRAELMEYYTHHARHDLPWRQAQADGSFEPYKIMVSELMLQQTQAARAVPKYTEFLGKFPNAHALAWSELGDVLQAWQGLGYNRRAKFLWQAAQIVDKLNYFPNTHSELVKLPGVGTNTAGAIMAYAYNAPVVFVETNIRSVYIHQFLTDQIDVDDTQIRSLVEQTLDTEEPRVFYWALMDYGNYLKATVGNLSIASKHYTRQSTFAGSKRQVRGQVIRLLGQKPHSRPELREQIDDERLTTVLHELLAEGLIRRRGSIFSL